MSVNLARQLSFNLVDDFELPKAANVAFKKRYSPLWLCLHFPQLALNLHELETGSPRLVVEEVKNRYVIHSACNMANELGIRSGMTLSSAHALCDDLTVYPRDKAQEKKALEKIADWAQQFTPTVSLVFDGNCVLLEIRASLLLFDGLLALQQTLLASLEKNYPYMVNLAVAPTPLASQVLSRLPGAVMIEEKSAIRSMLGHLPISVLLLDDKKIQHKLSKIGVETLKDLWRLPRDSLARRFSKTLIQHMDKLLGECADPQILYQAPLTFEKQLDLPYEVSNNKTLYLAAEKLLEDLSAFLIAHDSGVSCVYFRLYFFDKHFQDVELVLRECSRDAAHILLLLKERLDRLKLHAAVCKIRLKIEEVLPFIAHNLNIFPSSDMDSALGVDASDPDWVGLLEQLQNRFGLGAVQYLCEEQDHRPEFAWSYQTQKKRRPKQETEARPFWLLPRPRKLKQQKNRPCYLGLLRMLSGAERIESGWWEDNAIRRDYYRACDVDNRHLWIFKDLQQNQWYLHGFFA